MAEWLKGAGLENQKCVKAFVGSNPTPSANLENVMKGMRQLIGPTDPSTYQYTDEEWTEVCKRAPEDGFTAEEIIESARRNGCWSFYTSDIYISSKMEDGNIKEDFFNDGWRN